MRWETTLATVGVMLTAAVLVVAAATTNTVVMVIACLAAAYVLLLVVLGLERTAICTLAVAFAMAPMYKGLSPTESGATPMDVILLLGFLVLLPRLLGRSLRLPLGYVVGGVLVTVTGLIACATSDAVVTNLDHLAQWLMVMIGLPVAVALWRPSQRIINLLLGSYLAGHLTSLAWAMAEGPIDNGRYQGLTHHPNGFGAAGLVSVAILLYLFPRLRSTGGRLVVVLLMLLSLQSIFMSGSRAATVVAAGLILLVPIVERSALSGFALAAAGALVVVAFPLLVSVTGEGSAFARLAGDSDTSGADRERTTSREAGLEQFLSGPFVGDGFVGIDVIHDVFIEVAVATGVFGLVGYLMVVFAVARPLFGSGPQRRLGYLVWAFIGLSPAIPSLWDRALWVPMSLAILAAVRPSTGGVAARRTRRAQATTTPPGGASDASTGVSPRRA